MDGRSDKEYIDDEELAIEAEDASGGAGEGRGPGHPSTSRPAVSVYAERYLVKKDTIGISFNKQIGAWSGQRIVRGETIQSFPRTNIKKETVRPIPSLTTSYIQPHLNLPHMLTCSIHPT